MSGHAGSAFSEQRSLTARPNAFLMIAQPNSRNDVFAPRVRRMFSVAQP
jgi:hypothetical protein